MPTLNFIDTNAKSGGASSIRCKAGKSPFKTFWSALQKKEAKTQKNDFAKTFWLNGSLEIVEKKDCGFRGVLLWWVYVGIASTYPEDSRAV
jgi:hypothetical protein